MPLHAIGFILGSWADGSAPSGPGSTLIFSLVRTVLRQSRFVWREFSPSGLKEGVKLPKPVSEILAVMNSLPSPESAEDRRENFARLCSFSGKPVASVPWRDITFPARDGATLTIRLFGKDPSGYPSPLFLYFHGGGYVAGDLETHHAAITQLASRTTARIALLNYRRAPEHRYPTALHDAEDALTFCRESNELAGPKTQIVVGGDSAGGNLAAALSLSRGTDIAGQILLYPTLDAGFTGPSWQEYPQGYITNAEDAKAFNLLYARSEKDFKDPLFSPMQAEDFTGVPRAFIFLSEVDPARSDGQAYAEKLKAAGVQVRVKVYPEMPHGFFTMGGSVAGSRELLGDLALVLG
ncbi:MAG: alpha/beta hydrolase [Proteobacteria bacterium]|nr:MAG: alpha/beta hydrolase [Pseudomonadota bacterium]